MEDRKAERQAKLEAEERKAKLEFHVRALEINARSRPPPDSQSIFRVQTAAKLLTLVSHFANSTERTLLILHSECKTFSNVGCRVLIRMKM